MKRTIAAGIFIALIAGCKSQPVAASATAEPVVYKGVTDSACALEMSFGSYGSGIDGKALDKVTALLTSEKVAYTSKAIGREGETRLCLPLKGVSRRKKNSLIGRLKKIAKEGQLVSLSVR